MRCLPASVRALWSRGWRTGGSDGSSNPSLPAGPRERQWAAVSRLQAGGPVGSTRRRHRTDFVGAAFRSRRRRKVVRSAVYSLSASTGIRRCPAGSTTRSAPASVTAPSRGGSPSPAKVTCVGRTWSSTRTIVQPMSNGHGGPVGRAGPGRASHGHSEPLQQCPGYGSEGRAGVDRDLGVLEPGALLVAHGDGDPQLSHSVPPVGGFGDAGFPPPGPGYICARFTARL